MPPCFLGMVSKNDGGYFCYKSSRSPRKLLDFDYSPDDSRKLSLSSSAERMETSRLMSEDGDHEDLSPDCKALLSPRPKLQPNRFGGKRKFPGSTPGGHSSGVFSQVSPLRVMVRSPRNSPSKRTRLSFVGPAGESKDGFERSNLGKVSTSGLALLASRLPLQPIQNKPSSSGDFVFTPPVGLPPRRLPLSPVVNSPLIGSPSSSNDGFSELLTLDEDTNLPPAQCASSALNFSSLLKGSILAPTSTLPVGARAEDDRASTKPGRGGNSNIVEVMETDDTPNARAEKSAGSPCRARVPLRRALSYAGRTPVPRSASGIPVGKCARIQFDDLGDDGSPILVSKSKASVAGSSNNNHQIDNVAQTSSSACLSSGASASASASSASFAWDVESCPAPTNTKTRRLLHSVSEEGDDRTGSDDMTVTMPADAFSVLRERSANVVGTGGVPLTYFRSESVLAARAYRRSTSDSHAIINRALKRAELRPNLIADCSRPYCLPIVTDGVKHPDLKNISPETLAKVLRGDYSSVITRFMVIDCRFPYEFEGGHITGAVNIYTKDHILKEILPNEPCLPIATAGCVGGTGGGNHHGAGSSAGGVDSTLDSSPENCDNKERTIIIFHCEFSSERGPTLARFLRSRDRGLNAENYPALHFPELYLLEGGYKAFFEKHPEHCSPSAYRTMLDPNHAADLRHFKAKAKTWSGDPVATGAKRKHCKKHL